MAESPLSDELEELAPSPVSDDMTFSSQFERIDSPVSPTSSLQQRQQQRADSPPSSSTFLGFRKHNLPYYLHGAQRYSSYAFTVFATMHFTNTALIPLITRSVTESSRYLLLTRPYYQSWPIAEPFLVGVPLLVHITSGICLRLYHRRIALKHAGAESRKDKRTVRWPKVSTVSALGFASTVLVCGHAALTRGLPLVIEGGSSSVGLDFVGHGVALHPVLGIAAYTLLVGVAGAHMVQGWAKWLGLLPEQVLPTQRGADGKLRRKRRWWLLQGSVAAVVAVWIAGGVSVVANAGKVPGWVGRTYDDLLKHVPFLDRLI